MICFNKNVKLHPKEVMGEGGGGVWVPGVHHSAVSALLTPAQAYVLCLNQCGAAAAAVHRVCSPQRQQINSLAPFVRPSHSTALVPN